MSDHDYYMEIENIRSELLTIQTDIDNELREKDELIKNQQKTIDQLKKEIDFFENIVGLVNDHAETCSIFVYDEKGCTCFYEKIRKCQEELRKMRSESHEL